MTWSFTTLTMNVFIDESLAEAYEAPASARREQKLPVRHAKGRTVHGRHVVSGERARVMISSRRRVGRAMPSVAARGNVMDNELPTNAERDRKGAELAVEISDYIVISGYSVAEMLAYLAPKKLAAVAKYIDPADASKTWTGRGRRPQWLKDRLAAGVSLEMFLVKSNVSST